MMIQLLLKEHYPQVSKIYAQGLITGIATFETEVPTWKQWDKKFLKKCRFVALIGTEVLAWCALNKVSNRAVYRGVAEDTIYVAPQHRGKGIGKLLLKYLVSESEKEGFWSLQAAIFPENEASIQLHLNCGFRIVGRREKIAQRGGKWFDNKLLERRTSI
ncbi:MAG: N-acetyltransferase family protein [Bacteroidetes bacterium]|nr:MAG: N-acetyltransferase family protein [Bacteroidota bacterium]